MCHYLLFSLLCPPINGLPSNCLWSNLLIILRTQFKQKPTVRPSCGLLRVAKPLLTSRHFLLPDTSYFPSTTRSTFAELELGSLRTPLFAARCSASDRTWRSAVCFFAIPKTNIILWSTTSHASHHTYSSRAGWIRGCHIIERPLRTLR